MVTMIVELLVLFLALVVGWGYLGKRNDNFPPGPTGLSFLGQLSMLWAEAHKTLNNLKKTCGPMVGVRLGIYRAVVLNDVNIIREAMSLDAFSGRPRLNAFKARTDDGIVRGMFITDGSQWREQRRFVIRNLRQFGLGSKTMEKNIQEEIDDFLEILRAKVGTPVHVNTLFNRPVLNSLWSIMFSQRMTEDDPESLEALHGLATFATDARFFLNMATFLPWLAKLAPTLSGFKQMAESFSVIQKFIRNQVKIHNVHFVENQPRDFVDAYTDEMIKTTDPNSSFYPKNNVLPYTLADLFGAGAQTTSITLSWLIAYLIHYREVQEKLRVEIDEVIGKQRLPSLADRPTMPYAEAFINELLRMSSVLPSAIVHSTTEDVEFHGFSIPKGTIIIPNLYGVHYDEGIWGDPQNFRPERFIDSDLKLIGNMLAFSVGKRHCIGEKLARDQLFLYVTNILQNFCVLSAGKLTTLEPHVGLALLPRPFDVIFKMRVD